MFLLGPANVRAAPPPINVACLPPSASPRTAVFSRLLFFFARGLLSKSFHFPAWRPWRGLVPLWLRGAPSPVGPRAAAPLAAGASYFRRRHWRGRGGAALRRCGGRVGPCHQAHVPALGDQKEAQARAFEAQLHHLGPPHACAEASSGAVERHAVKYTTSSYFRRGLINFYTRLSRRGA